MQVQKQQLEPDMEQQTGSKLRKEYNKGAYCHSAYLTSVQSTSCEMLGWMNHKVESRLLVVQLCLTLCDPMDCSMPGYPVLQYLPEFAQTHIH